MPAGGDQSIVQNLANAPRRAKFAIEYARNGGDAYKAMIDAGYSESTAKAQQSTVLKDERVQAMIERQRKAMCVVAGITKDSIIQREEDWANLDPANYYEPADHPTNPGGLKPIHELPLAARRCIKKIKHQDIGGLRTVEYEFFDPGRSNKNLADWTGVSKDDNGDRSPEDTANAIAAFLTAARKSVSKDSGFEAPNGGDS